MTHYRHHGPFVTGPYLMRYMPVYGIENRSGARQNLLGEWLAGRRRVLEAQERRRSLIPTPDTDWWFPLSH